MSLSRAQANKLAVPLKFRHYVRATPQGDVHFPATMLTTDQCYPLRETDSSIASVGRFGDFCGTPVMLLKFGPTEKPGWRVQEWEKAGWVLEETCSGGQRFSYTDRVERAGQAYRFVHAARIVRTKRSFTFAVDMLRYDRCFPYNHVDGQALLNMLRGGDPVDIRVVGYSELAKPTWTDGRWDSFGWKVEPCSYFEFLRGD